MKKEVYTVSLAYTFDPAHKGANYSLDGQHWINGGEFAEVITKAVLGFEATKDPNSRYDLASDIEELQVSVKSSRFTLVNKVLGDSFEESLNRYFETVHSNLWIYTVVVDDSAILYYMDKEEFKSFVEAFCFFNERKAIRCKATSGKMIKWFEERV